MLNQSPTHQNPTSPNQKVNQVTTIKTKNNPKPVNPQEMPKKLTNQTNINRPASTQAKLSQTQQTKQQKRQAQPNNKTTNKTPKSCDISVQQIPKFKPPANENPTHKQNSANTETNNHDKVKTRKSNTQIKAPKTKYATTKSQNQAKTKSKQEFKSTKQKSNPKSQTNKTQNKS